MSGQREAQLGIVSGKKGCGKTYETLRVQIKNTLTGSGGKTKPRKVLILDVNNEYGDAQIVHKRPDFPNIKALDVDDLYLWMKQPLIEARRISVMKPSSKGGGKMSQKELQQTLSRILDVYRNGVLIIEDLTNFVSDSLPGDLVGSIVTQRHVSVDVIIHFQSIGKAAHPKLWANANWFRMHVTSDTVAKNKNKLDGVDLTPLYIAENMIKKKEVTGDKRMYVYYHLNTTAQLVGKITGAFSQQMFKEAYEKHLEDNISVVNAEIKRENIYTGKRYHNTRVEAINFLIKEAFRKYYGNPDYTQNQPKKISRPDFGKTNANIQQ
jgi:hypothetical protein